MIAVFGGKLVGGNAFFEAAWSLDDLFGEISIQACGGIHGDVAQTGFQTNSDLRTQIGQGRKLPNKYTDDQRKAEGGKHQYGTAGFHPSRNSDFPWACANALTSLTEKIRIIFACTRPFYM